ncbi:ATP-binding protein [Siculibacillus lacustris]|uniref:ATP-binding protein n=1 Tax=Siculibacillus lacustris TaxID=1549641 RepID=A0A4Q9VYB6_9HYPH|nr:terminase family protein [Siculibacillus lacustris]TBW40995.1 ATP-binding protein [Siculibacillus lacustris]
MSSASILRAALRACDERTELDRAVLALTAAERERLRDDWSIWARPDQLPPDGDWTTWLLLGGRGAGKTRAGAEWVKAMALGRPPFADRPAGRIALVGETHADVRDVMIEGVSGLLRIHRRAERPQWKSSLRRLEWPNGAVAQAFSSEDPEALRGPQFEIAWADEIAKWRHAEEVWDMLQFGLRLGDRPRQVATTTPRPVALVKRLVGDPACAVSRASTRANAWNLAPRFLDAVVGRYQGTRLGRQELDGELIEDRDDALWRRDEIERGRLDVAPPMTRIVVAVDPPATSGASADACGIVAAGLGEDGVAHVLADASARGLRPSEWAARALALHETLDADALVVEVNQGGEMVEAVLREIEPGVAIEAVRATRGKWLRAEPIAALYAQGRVRHVGPFPELEDELCDFGPQGLSSGRSPDRLDALVWALTALMLKGRGRPKVRGL